MPTMRERINNWLGRDNTPLPTEEQMQAYETHHANMTQRDQVAADAEREAQLQQETRMGAARRDNAAALNETTAEAQSGLETHQRNLGTIESEAAAQRLADQQALDGQTIATGRVQHSDELAHMDAVNDRTRAANDAERQHRTQMGDLSVDEAQRMDGVTADAQTRAEQHGRTMASDELAAQERMNAEKLKHTADMNEQTQAARDIEREAAHEHQVRTNQTDLEHLHDTNTERRTAADTERASQLDHEKNMGDAQVDTAERLDGVTAGAQTRKEAHHRTLNEIEEERAASRLEAQKRSNLEKQEHIVKEGEATATATRTTAKADADAVTMVSDAETKATRDAGSAERFATEEVAKGDAYATRTTANAEADATRTTASAEAAATRTEARAARYAEEQAATAAANAAKTTAKGARKVAWHERIKAWWDAGKDKTAARSKVAVEKIEKDAMRAEQIAAAEAGVKVAELEAEALSVAARTKNAGMAILAVGAGAAAMMGAAAVDLIRRPKDEVAKYNNAKNATLDPQVAASIQSFNDPYARQGQWAASIGQEQASMDTSLRR